MPQSSTPEPGDESSSSWGGAVKTLGAVGGLGIELAAAVAGGAIFGGWLDTSWGTDPWMTLIFISAGVIAFAVHMAYLLKWMKRQTDEQEE